MALKRINKEMAAIESKFHDRKIGSVSISGRTTEALSQLASKSAYLAAYVPHDVWGYDFHPCQNIL
jgi:hypothetical protein